MSYYVSSAAEGTKYYGGKILEKGSEQLEYVQSAPLVNDFTERSKSTLGAIGGTVSGLSNVSINVSKCIASIPEIQDCTSGRG